MTATFPDQYSKTRIFILSALGSLLLHALLVAGLSYLHNTQIVKDEMPTVQLTLLPAQQIPQTSHTPAPPMQPRAAMQKSPSPPFPPTPMDKANPSEEP